MGLSISTLLFTQLMYQPSVKFNNVVQFYKCPLPILDVDISDQFLFEEDNFVILSTPNATIVTIEESDF